MLEKYLATRCEFGAALKPLFPTELIFTSQTERMNLKVIILIILK